MRIKQGCVASADRCPYHTKCRADLGRPAHHLCGYHHAKTWSWCIWFREYERDDTGKNESIDEAIMKGNEAISETISR